MANQITLPEVAKVKSYLAWLKEKSGISGGEKDALARILLETDFRWTVEDDKNRAEDGLKWRERYADEVGEPFGKLQQDRIRKTIHGKTSCFEVILSLSEELDAMVNEDEESMTPLFFGILLKNLGVFEEDFCESEGAKDEKNERNFDEKTREILKKWLDRDSNFELFPVTKSVTKVSQKCHNVTEKCEKLSLWMKMNLWIEVNSDENGHFCDRKVSQCHKSVTGL